MALGIETYGTLETLKLSETISLGDYLDLLKLTHDIRLEREKKLAAQRGEVHPEERRRVEEALDKTLENLGEIEIDGIKFNEQRVQAPVSKRRKQNDTSQETRATSQESSNNS